MPLVGREQESATLRGLLGRATAGRGSLVLVSGEPGNGKRSLVADLTAYARAGGAAVLARRAVASSGPYRAVTDVEPRARWRAVLSLGRDFDDPDGGFAAAYGLAREEALLVRPDGYVAWAGRVTGLDEGTAAVIGSPTLVRA